MDSAYSGLEPLDLWRHFAKLNSIPRCSGQEAGARAYVQQVADATGVEYRVDAGGNLVVYVPSRGSNAAPTVAVQTHLDMVCEKQPNVAHDFTRDPIRPYRHKDRIFATGTTLGADNGIGVAACLALLSEPALQHGPLELVFTVEEETGLEGVLKLDSTLLQARLLVNLDGEDPDELIVGSAGATGVLLRFSPITDSAPSAWIGYEVVVSGMKGGHSGLQIGERHGNAIKLLASILTRAQNDGIKFHLSSIKGGSAHNVIPRSATAVLSIAPDKVPTLKSFIGKTTDAFRDEWGQDEPNLTLDTSEVSAPASVLSDRSCELILRLIDDLPHGVLAMSQSFPNKVETSSNLAYVETQDSRIEIMVSNRSFSDAQLKKLQSHVSSVGEAVGAQIDIQQGYPGWEPNPHSNLLKTTSDVYEQVYEKRPEVEVVHGGLECGVMVSKLPDMDAISFGPLIEGAHTVEECVYIPSVASTWQLLVALLKRLS